MSENCFKNTVIREGSSRFSLLAPALKSGYVKVDERDFDELLEFIQKIGNEFIYKDNTNADFGGWYEFFVKKIDESGHTEPHFALFVAFLEILSKAQDEINKIGDSHTSYFYSEVLGLERVDPVSDTVYLIAELAKHIASAELSDGTLFKTGIKVDKIEKLYSLVKDFSFNKIEINGLCTLNTPDNYTLYAGSVANSGDGAGSEIETTDKSWLAFGDDTRTPGTFGFGISSPVLMMSEGSRNITLTITTNLTSASNTTFDLTDFSIYISAEKGWVSPDSAPESTVVTLNNGVFTMEFGFTKAIEPIVAPIAKIHGAEYTQSDPVLKILFSGSAPNAAFVALRGAQITSFTTTVDVSEVSTLILQNENGVLDPAKPVQPFGALPKIGSKFYIGCEEIFLKNTSVVSGNFKWRDKPAQNFSAYYANYWSVDAVDGIVDGLTDDSFLLSPYYRDSFQWKTGGSPIKMFPTPSSGIYTWTLLDATASDIPGKADTNLGDRYQTTTERGYFMVELGGSDFLHSEFQKSYALGVIKGLDSNEDDPLAFVPNNPYTPELELLYLDYTASETVSVFDTTVTAKTNFTTRRGKCYQFGPFGYAEKHSYLNTNQNTAPELMPTFSNQGELFLGLKGAVPPQNLTMLVQVSEGSSDPELDAADVKWSYLRNNEWIPFEKTQVLSEQTMGFLQTGLISLSIPSDANSTNTWMPTSLVWLRASVASNPDAVCRIIDIVPQACEAALDTSNSIEPTGEIIPAGTISKLKEPLSSFKSFSQPYSSFGGSGTENDEDYYTRVSQRLRHKARAITVWDYERIVLQEFSDIYKAKCINHTKYNGSDGGYQSLKPGWTTVVVVPNTYNKNAIDPYRPKVSTAIRTQVKNFLLTCCSPHVSLEVQNPIYEEIKVSLEVKFMDGEDAGICAEKLATRINELLAPWAFNSDIEIGFGGTIHKNTIVYHLEKLEYVDFIQCVKMYQISPDWLGVNAAEDREVIQTTTMASVLTTSDTHEINILDLDECDCTNSAENYVTGVEFFEIEDCGCEDK